MSLISLTDYKRAISETDSSKDTFHQDALDAASSAIINYTERDFNTTIVTGDKAYWYNGSGVLDIADASTVHAVTVAGQQALPAASWIAKTEGPPQLLVYTFIELPRIDWSQGTFVDSMGVMGFTSNLDNYLLLHSNIATANREIQVTVNADFGWPVVPDDVKRATIWTAKEFETITPSGGEGGDLSSKSVAEVSESFFAASTSRGLEPPEEAIPAHARALLDAYARERST